MYNHSMVRSHRQELVGSSSRIIHQCDEILFEAEHHSSFFLIFVKGFYNERFEIGTSAGKQSSPSTNNMFHSVMIHRFHSLKSHTKVPPRDPYH